MLSSSRDVCPEAVCPLRDGNHTLWKYCAKCGTRARPIEVPPFIDSAIPENGIYDALISGGDSALEVEPEVLDGRAVVQSYVVTPFGQAIRLDLSQMSEGEVAQLRVKTSDARRTDLWDPRPQRSQPLRIARQNPKIDIVPVPAVALFLGGKLESTVFLENRGNSTVRVNSPQMPYGYLCADPTLASGFALAPGERRQIDIQRALGTQAGELTFTDHQGKPLTKVRLLPIAPPAPVSPPGLVVAVDFGTTNTSVFCQDTRTAIPEPVELMGDGRVRRETLLYAPEDVERVQWRAIDVAGLPPQDIRRDLKTLVRERQPGSRERLEFYLRALLRNGIADYLRGRNPGDERPVEFVFTVPVLDGEDGTEHKAYRETLLDAARTAGYEDRSRSWSVATMMEPDAGALDVISVPDHGVHFSDGDRMLIVDIGGGTTDVTLGVIRLSGARPQLNDIENTGIDVNGKPFAGERTTYLLGWRWALSDQSGILPSGPEVELLIAKNELSKVKQLIEYGWVADPSRANEALNSWTTLDDVQAHPHDDNWTRRFTDLYHQMTLAKHHLCNEAMRMSDKPWAVPEYRFDSRPGGPKWPVPVLLLESAVKEASKQFVATIETFLAERGLNLQQVNHVSLIGGSARLEPIRRALDEMFPGRLLPVGPYVDVAVCRGATRMHQAPPPILPVGFNLLVAGKHTELIRPGAAVGKVVRRRRQLNAPTEHAVEAVMECVLPDGDAVPFLSLKFRNGFNGEIAASISASTIRLSAEPASGSPTVYEVSLT